MATTGELQAIIEALELIDIGDAAKYLGEEGMVEDESVALKLQDGLSDSSDVFYGGYAISSQTDSLN
jgi:hypothetical protein